MLKVEVRNSKSLGYQATVSGQGFGANSEWKRDEQEAIADALEVLAALVRSKRCDPFVSDEEISLP